jgi:hypothetical protein
MASPNLLLRARRVPLVTLDLDEVVTLDDCPEDDIEGEKSLMTKRSARIRF